MGVFFCVQGSGYLTGPLTPLEVVAWVLWLASLAMEHRADLQKRAFIRQCARDKVKNAICEVGLWRYSRHPNYFFEWMVSGQCSGFVSQSVTVE